jgi:hypothetical protein
MKHKHYDCGKVVAEVSKVAEIMKLVKQTKELVDKLTSDEACLLDVAMEMFNREA